MPDSPGATSSAVTSAPPPNPNQRVRPGCRPDSAATRESSALATKTPPGFKPSRISPLAGSNRVERSQELEVLGRDARDRRDVRLEGPGKPRDLSERAHSHLSDHPVEPSLKIDDGHREPDRAVLVPRRLLDGESPGEDRGGEFLRGRLPDRARDRRQAEPGFSLHRARELQERLPRIGDLQDREIPRQARGAPLPEHRARARRSGLRREVMAVHSRSGQRHEEVARPDPPGIHRDAGEHRFGAGRRERRVDHPRDLRQGEVHRRASSAATSRSSNGRT